MQPFKDQYLCFVGGKVHISSVSKYSSHSLFFCVSYWATTLVHMLVSAFNLCSPAMLFEFLSICLHVRSRFSKYWSWYITLHTILQCVSNFIASTKVLKKCYSYDGGELSIDFVSQHQLSFPLAQFEASTDMWFLIKL